MFFAGVGRVEFRELPEHSCPGGDLLLCVVHMGQGLAVLVVVGDVREVLASCAVLRVCEAGVVGVQLRTVRQNLIRESVQVTDSTGEPGHRIC